MALSPDPRDSAFMRSPLTLPPRAQGGLIHAIVDSPAGSTNKYKFDEARGMYALSRMLPAGLHFPCDFGFVPGTRAADGDALDVALIYPGSSFVGCLMSARLLGVIFATQTERGKTIQNHRLVAVPVTAANRPRE